MLGIVGEKSLPKSEVAIECPGLLVLTAKPEGVRALTETEATRPLKGGQKKSNQFVE
jgi:hypothetical protein